MHFCGLDAHVNAVEARPRHAARAARAGASAACWLALLLLLPGGLRAAAPERESRWQVHEKAVEYDPGAAVARGLEALRAARERADPAAQLDALNLLSLARAGTGETANHDDDERRGMQLAQELGDAGAQCWYLDGQAWVHWLEGRHAEAIAHWDRAIALAERHGLDTRRAWIYSSRGGSMQAAGRKAEAMEWLAKAYGVFEAQQDRFGMAAVLGNIGDVYGGATAPAADQAKAAEHYERALALVDPAAYRRFAAEMYLRLGLTQFRRNNAAEARRLLAKALPLAQQLGFHQLEALTNFHLGSIEMAERRDGAALAHTERGLALFEQHPNPMMNLRALVHRAELLARLQRRPESLDALAAARRQLAEAHTPDNEAYFLPRAANTLAELGEHEEALRLLRAAREADRKLTEAVNAKLGDELRVRFQVELKEAENTALRSRQREADTRRLALTLALALGLLAMASVALFLRRRAQAARTQATHHEALAKAEAARADAETAANRAKSDFLANMSHELRSPLNAMLGFTRLLARDATLPARARDDMDIVLNSGEHLHGLINQVLELSKIEAGRAGVVEVEFDVEALLEEMADLFSAQARQAGLQLAVERAGDLPQRVRADAVKLRQVLINLLGNAIKFTERGGVTLRASAPRGKLHFEVADSGVGIAADELTQLGVPFVQAKAGRRAAEGTGLGLAICRGFVELMGGRLQISSTPGEGTTVAFTVPVETASPLAEAPVAPRRRVRGLAAGQPAWRILAVDDRPESRRLLNRLLTPLGFEVREAANGLEAVQVAEQWRPHLVWMDMRMPVMDGREATGRIKALPGGRETVVVALTASSFEEQREQILACGCDDFLRKPFREEVLFDAMTRHLGVRFKYEDDEPAVPAAPPSAPSPQALPEALRERLSGAIERLDVAAIECAIDELRPHDAASAETLARMAGRFDYGAMQDWLQRSLP